MSKPPRAGDDNEGTNSVSSKGPPAKGASPTEVAWRGIDACREGDWNDGLYWLGMAARIKATTEMPSQFYAYLGYAIARFQNQKVQGVKLCRYALELEFYQPENYVFLARTLLMV
ncbi:MAG: hypothetical protein AAGD38_11700, partial [Acidobacteriota bacterium]